jgi:hypothetical protein
MKIYAVYETSWSGTQFWPENKLGTEVVAAFTDFEYALQYMRKMQRTKHERVFPNVDGCIDALTYRIAPAKLYGRITAREMLR